MTPSTAEYASSIFFVKKPNGGIKLCVDYKGLNAVIKKNKYFVFFIDEIIVKVIKAKFYIKFDIIKTFHRLRMVSSKNEELTIWICSLKTYKYKIMSFDLCEKLDSYQQFMNNHFKNIIDFVFCYIDDILIFFKIKKKHREHINKVLHKFREIKLTIDIVKSVFYT